MLLSIIVGALFIAGGLIVGVVSYFGSMFDAPGATAPWDAYLIAVVAVGIGIAIVAFR